MTQIRGAAPVLPADLAKTDASNTWTGTQDFTAATVLGVSGPGGSSPDATTTSKGLVQLAGDLAGTAAAPTVPGLAGKVNASALAAVATSGAYTDLSGRPALAAVATSGAYTDLSGRPALAAVATSGAYSDLSGAPAAPILRGKTTPNTTSTTTQALDPELQVAGLAVGRYIIEGALVGGSGVNGTFGLGVANGAAVNAQYIAAIPPSVYSQTFASTGTITANAAVTFTGALQVTTAGTVGMTFWTATNGSAATLAPGSWLRLTKVA